MEFFPRFSLRDLCYGSSLFVNFYSTFTLFTFTVAEGIPPPMLNQLCGSPLDQLPCAIEDLPNSSGYGSEKIQEMVQLRVSEVKRRSHAVENHWSLNKMKKISFRKHFNLMSRKHFLVPGIFFFFAL